MRAFIAFAALKFGFSLVFPYLCKQYKLRIMRKWIGMTVVLALMGCSTLTPAEKEAQRKATAQAVEKALADRHYTIDVQMMYPQRGPAKNMTSNYSLEVRGDTLVSYLPYIGRAYLVPYGGGKGLMERYSVAKDAKGQTIVTFGVTNEEDTYEYQLGIFDNGSATIDVRSKQRDPISFSGVMAEE